MIKKNALTISGYDQHSLYHGVPILQNKLCRLPIKMAPSSIGSQKVKLNLGSFLHDTDENTGDNDKKNTNSPPDTLTWRRDPEDSLSDWTIVITTKGSALGGNAADDEALETVQTYHVHKAIVGAGPRGSQYFLRLFKSNQPLLESTTSTSHIELGLSAAAAFPNMLDFMYDMHSTDVEASAATAVALRYLANYFGVPTLFDSVNKFIQNDMDKDNIHIYLKEAKLYQDETIIEGTMEVGARVWHELLKKQKSPIYGELLPQEKLLHFTKLVGGVNGELVQVNGELVQVNGELVQVNGDLRRQLKQKVSEIERFHPLPIDVQYSRTSNNVTVDGRFYAGFYRK